MKRNIMAALSGVAFFYALGIVGAVEQGAALSRLWLTLPALAVGWLFALLAQNA